MKFKETTILRGNLQGFSAVQPIAQQPSQSFGAARQVSEA